MSRKKPSVLHRVFSPCVLLIVFASACGHLPTRSESAADAEPHGAASGQPQPGSGETAAPVQGTVPDEEAVPGDTTGETTAAGQDAEPGRPLGPEETAWAEGAVERGGAVTPGEEMETVGPQGAEIASARGQTIEELAADLERRAAAARMHLAAGSIAEAIHAAVSVIGSAVESADLRPSEPVRAARGILEEVCSSLSVKPAPGWELWYDCVLTPEAPNSEPLPPPGFYLVYGRGAAAAAVPDISFDIALMDGRADLGELGTTDRRGFGSVHMQRESPDRVVCRLRFFAQAGRYRHTFVSSVYYFYLPEPVAVVDVEVGERMASLLARLEETGLTTAAALQALADGEEYPDWGFVPPTGFGISRFEGLFEPGRYSIPKRDLLTLQPGDPEGPEEAARLNARRIVVAMLGESADRYVDLAEVHGLSAYEQIILASIVEKEAVSNTDYAKVASVLLNRLRGGSKLGSCPTVEYALNYHRPFLTYEDIAIDSPYNVYIRKGLPPTPICFFTEEALNAVRSPLETDLYYFVYDWTTEQLYFASSYSDHLDNAERSRANFAEKHGREALHEIRHDKFYEP